MAMNGTIKRMVSEKGFGFVAAEDGNEYLLPPVRVHQHALRQHARGPGGHVRARPGSQGPARRERQARLVARQSGAVSPPARPARMWPRARVLTPAAFRQGRPARTPRRAAFAMSAHGISWDRDAVWRRPRRWRAAALQGCPPIATAKPGPMEPGVFRPRDCRRPARTPPLPRRESWPCRTAAPMRPLAAAAVRSPCTPG